MVQTEIAQTRAEPSKYNVERGQIWQLGRHRLMCGDAGSARDVAVLMSGAQCDLVFTSPPYANARSYKSAIACWPTLMQRVCGALPAHALTQVLFNIGLIHQKGEWSWYWVDLIKAMESQSWKRAAWLIWDKVSGIPGIPSHGKPTPQHEFIFAFRRNKRTLNRVLPCIRAGKATSVNTRQPSGKFRYAQAKRVIVSDRKIIGSVVSVAPLRNNQSGHPAPFPVALPTVFIESYTDENQKVFDPFCGSGTTLIAAEQSGRIGYGMEIAPEYVEMALNRWSKLYPDQLCTLSKPSS